MGNAFDAQKTDAELTEMLKAMGHSEHVQKGPSPPEPYVTRVTDDSPASDRLAVLRAKQIAGQAVDPDEYEAVHREVIEGSDPKEHVLWLYLERTYDCEVCELEADRGGVYGFKIRTPKGTFLDYATRKELLDFMDKLGIQRQ